MMYIILKVLESVCVGPAAVTGITAMHGVHL